MLKDKYKKCEKINKVIYEQSPSEGFVHAMVMGNILYAIKRQLKGSGWILTAGNYTLKLSDDEYAVPDIMLFNDKEHITNRSYHGTPGFIAEIEGPLTKVKDRTVKMDAYAKLGVKEYWLIDPMEKKIEIYYLQTGKYILQESYAMEDIEKSPDYNTEISIVLKNVSVVRVTIGEVFSGI